MPTSTKRPTAPASPGAVAVSGALKRAVIYLRVSTAQQAQRDGDPEGYSISAQRDACLHKAKILGAVVAKGDEFIDAGASGKSANRLALQRMLDRITAQRDVDYVIVHKIDRLARNRFDDARILMAVRAAGARPISVTENIDESASGLLLHGVMASVAEYHSNNLRTEVLKGTVKKAERGGTPHMAPLSYLNVKSVDGGEVKRSIELDPVRAPLMRWAFEAYATGGWSITQLLRELTERGLTNRPSANRPERPVHRSRLHKLLHDSYYMGIVTYRGVQYEGKHEPLITPQVFNKVQELLRASNIAGEKQRKHHHHLKGSLYCGRCKSRMSVSRFVGHGGEYLYFFCLGRQTKRTHCELPYVKADEMESAVQRSWEVLVGLTPKEIELVRTGLLADLRRERSEAGNLIAKAQARLTGIEFERRSWAEKTANGSIPEDIGREKQNELLNVLIRAKADLADLEAASEDIEDLVNKALDLVRDCASAYRAASAKEKREWCQLFFEALWVEVDEVTGAKFTPFGEVFLGVGGLAQSYLRQSNGHNRASSRAGRGHSPRGRTSMTRGLRECSLVRARGLEPPSP
jgi:site-specific DNA recombinase